ncbi:MAG TPA: hypothetical protein PLQ93_12675, partial [Bacteroidia bacterium]|nr:hypothetical protein [Bacteroidia bacterium]
RSSGVVSNPLSLITTNLNSYGCEFSNDGSKLYGLFQNGPQSTPLIQWNLCAGSPSAIIASSFVMTYTPTGQYGSAQLASDGKIYIASNNQNSLSVIQNPNAGGIACNFTPLAQILGSQNSRYGLPNFVSSFFYTKPAAFGFSVSVSSACRQFTFSAPSVNVGCPACNYQNLSWQFGDPASGTANFSNQQNPVHIFSNGGNYQVKLLLQGNCQTDTLIQTINVQAPVLNTNGNFSICPNQSLTLTASGANTYTWSTGAQSSNITVSPAISSFYTVTGTGTLNGCSSSKVFTVTVLSCTGLMDFIAGDQYALIKPNPNAGEFEIELDRDAEAEICDLRGFSIQKILCTKGRSAFKLEALAPGLYLVKIYSERTCRVLRLIIE